VHGGGAEHGVRGGGGMLGLKSSFAITTAFALAACATTAGPTCAPGTSPMTKFELFLGRNIGTTGRVSEDDWRRFLAEEVTARYPDGFTVLDRSEEHTS